MRPDQTRLTFALALWLVLGVGACGGAGAGGCSGGDAELPGPPGLAQKLAYFAPTGASFAAGLRPSHMLSMTNGLDNKLFQDQLQAQKVVPPDLAVMLTKVEYALAFGRLVYTNPDNPVEAMVYVLGHGVEGHLDALRVWLVDYPEWIAERVPGGLVVGAPAYVTATLGATTQLPEEGLVQLLRSADGDAGLVVAGGYSEPSVQQALFSIGESERGTKFRLQVFPLTQELERVARGGILAARQFVKSPTFLQMLKEAKRRGELAGYTDGTLGARLLSEAAAGFKEFVPNLNLEVAADVGVLSSSTRHRAAVALAAVLAVVSVPPFIKYMRRSKASEARSNLSRIYKGAAAAFAAGKKGACGFPGGQEVCTPPNESRCEESRGGLYSANSARWNKEPWKALGFRLDEPHFFQYCFKSSGVGKSAAFTATAYGDLDCDGIRSTFRLVGHSGAGDACQMKGRGTFSSERDIE